MTVPEHEPSPEVIARRLYTSLAYIFEKADTRSRIPALRSMIRYSEGLALQLQTDEGERYLLVQCDRIVDGSKVYLVVDPYTEARTQQYNEIVLARWLEIDSSGRVFESLKFGMSPEEARAQRLPYDIRVHEQELSNLIDHLIDSSSTVTAP